MSKNYDGEITALNNIIRIGTVSSVNNSDRTARVEFKDKGLISGPLRVIKYSSITTIKSASLEYAGEEKSHKHDVTITPWLPSVGEMVVCIFIPKGDGDGFILGGV